MIARPSYGGEREPDSHPTPGPPTIVQSAREPLPFGAGAAEQPGGCPFSGEVPACSSPAAPSRPTSPPPPGSPPPWPGRRGTRRPRSSPRCSTAYARVFHPAVRYAGDEDVDVPWAEVAAANGTAAHPLMEWTSITGSDGLPRRGQPDPLWDDPPPWAICPSTSPRAWPPCCARHTPRPTTAGSACPPRGLPRSGPRPGAAGDAGAPAGPRPGRARRGQLVPEPASQSANAWWPADRAWFVATDVDLVTTYVGGSAALVASPAGRRRRSRPHRPTPGQRDDVGRRRGSTHRRSTPRRPKTSDRLPSERREVWSASASRCPRRCRCPWPLPPSHAGDRVSVEDVIRFGAIVLLVSLAVAGRAASATG